MKNDILRAYRRGLFREAWEHLAAVRDSETDAASLRAELLVMLGHHAAAKVQAERVLVGRAVPQHCVSMCLGVLSDVAWHAGDLEGGLELTRRSLTAAEDAKHLPGVCRITLRLLERTCNRDGYDATLPLARLAKRLVTRCGDAHLTALAHVTFGGLEGRAGRTAISEKHFRLAHQLLDADPNHQIVCAAYVDQASLLTLLGDTTGAVVAAEKGIAHASLSGWSAGAVAGFATLAFLQVCMGRIGDARKLIRSARLEPFQSPSYTLTLADTEARASMVAGNYEEAAAILNSARANRSDVEAWYNLLADLTLLRLLLRQHRWSEAASFARERLEIARVSRLRNFANVFRLHEVEAKLASGAIVAHNDLPLRDDILTWPLGEVGLTYYVLGLALVKGDEHTRGVEFLRRATTLSRLTGDAFATELEGGGSPNLYRQTSAGQALDSAVALLELAAHPHILGREAFTLIDEAGCARSLVLVAAGPLGARVIATAGIAEADAAAAAAAGPDDRIPLGSHRDEQWALLAAPGPRIDQQCTLAAIRKLLGMAVTLERYRREEKQRAALWPAEELEGDPESLWASEQAAEILGIARRIAATPLPVLLTGETGTGKEMLARAIHRASDRADRPLVPFNCSAMPRDLVESQLFGYRKGAYTGADTPFPGVIRSAAGGTLFLDEIADVPIELQPKLLRFLEHQEVQPLGESQPLRVDVRVIAATNASLEALVSQGRFREDLLYRLNVIQLRLPPLRERREEIPTLIQHYIRKHGDELKKGQLTLSDETLEYLLLYSWPGNIRQLANEVRRMVALAEPDSTLTPALLSPEIQASRRTIPASSSSATPEIRVPLDQPLPLAVDTVERMLVRRALERSHGRVEEAARLLGISRKGLFLKRRRWGLRQAS